MITAKYPHLGPLKESMKNMQNYQHSWQISILDFINNRALGQSKLEMNCEATVPRLAPLNLPAQNVTFIQLTWFY